MKTILILMLAAAGLSVRANTNVIIGKGNAKGTVMIFGSATDHEAWRFYETLTVEAKEINGKWTKVYAFDSANGEKVLRVSCVFSKIIKENGSCTATFFPAAGVLIDGSAGTIEYISPDPAEAARLAAGFEPPDTDGLVYANDNGRFTVRAEFSGGILQSMSLTYK